MNNIYLNKFLILEIIFLLLSSNLLIAQKIFISDINNKPIANASVIVQVYYRATDYLIRDTKEKFFSVVTDTSGEITIAGEFQKEIFQVDSVVISIQHENYLPKKITTLDYSTDTKFSYKIYLVNRKNDVKIVSMPTEERNELDIYTTFEISKKLNVDEIEVIKLIESKKLRAKKIGQKYFVSGNDLRKYLEE